MRIASEKTDQKNLDRLRILGLSRIPRCAACTRYKVLKSAYTSGRSSSRLPPVPLECDHPICAPLVSRWVRSIA